VQTVQRVVERVVETVVGAAAGAMSIDQIMNMPSMSTSSGPASTVSNIGTASPSGTAVGVTMGAVGTTAVASTVTVAQKPAPVAAPRIRTLASSSVTSSAAMNEADLQLAASAILAKAGVDSRGEQYRFISAFIPTLGDVPLPGLILTRPLTFEGAVERITGISGRHTEGVFALSRQDAEGLVAVFGGPIFGRPQPEIRPGSLPGFFWHFHPMGRPDAHVWFIP